MTATIMDEFQVLQRYHVLVLDREAAEADGYRINGVEQQTTPCPKTLSPSATAAVSKGKTWNL